MVKTTKKTEPLTREKIHKYVWDRYIDDIKPDFEVDEEDALHFFEKFYGKHPLNEDDECFYYGILLYERAFLDERNRARYFVKAKEVLEVYRSVSGETEWDVIEDRYADVCDVIEQENLLDQLKTAADLAPEIPGMVLVPAGPFRFGKEGKEIVLEPFYIDVRPVSNKQYREFLEETQYRTPRIWDSNPEMSGDDLPVTGVSWMDALQYCKWAQKSLPTAQQWEKAARGPEGFTYPWGEDEPTEELANFWDGIQEPSLQPLTKYSNASPYGVYAMVGTVWEWTNTQHPFEEGAHVIMGGSWADPVNPAYLSGMATMWANKKEKVDIIGFRCAKALEV